MTVTIELSPEIEADLKAQAEARGLPLVHYLQDLLRERASLVADPLLSPGERAALWRKSAKGLPYSPPLSDEAISRESIYGDRG
jgi:hypothetical protein